jgi:hypothetical protein
MNDNRNVAAIFDANFINFSPIFALMDVGIDCPNLERLDGYVQEENHFRVALPELDTCLTCADAAAHAFKIPKGQTASIQGDGFMGIYTPKMPPALGGIASYSVGRVYPKPNTLIIFEASTENPLVIEQNLTEDYHHVLFFFGKTFQKGHASSPVIVEEVATPEGEAEQEAERDAKIISLMEELKKLKEGS